MGAEDRMSAGARSAAGEDVPATTARAGHVASPAARAASAGACSAARVSRPAPRRIVIGVSGASGAMLGLECLRLLEPTDVETHLVLTHGAELTIAQELGISVEEFASHASVVHDNADIGASIASGTFRTMGMIVAPCSMKTLAGVANGFSENLLLRAADVTMKEQRPLVLMVRESPLSAIHVDNMARVARVPGVRLMPPLLTCYSGQLTVADMVHHVAAKALDVFGVETPGFQRWHDCD